MPEPTDVGPQTIPPSEGGLPPPTAQPTVDSATRDPAQSEVIGTLLFTGVVVLLIALVGMFVLSGVDTTNEPATDLEIRANSTAVILTHGGGDDLAATDVLVSFGRDASGSDGLENWSEVAGDGDGLFEGSERRTAGHGGGEVVSVTVVHEPTNTVLGRESLDVS